MKPNFDKKILDNINLKVFRSGIKKNKEDLLLITLPKLIYIRCIYKVDESAVNFCKKI